MADREVGLDRRVERHQQKLHRVLEVQVRVVATNQDGTAVLGLADLDEGRVLAGLDEVPLRIHEEQAGRHTCNLATEYQGRVEVRGVGPAARVGLRVDRVGQDPTHEPSRLEHRRDLEDRRMTLRRHLRPLVQGAHHGLGRGQVPRRKPRPSLISVGAGPTGAGRTEAC